MYPRQVATLKKLRLLDPDKCNIVRFYHAFVDRGDICIVFEQLDQSVADLMRSRNPHRLHLKEIRPIVQLVCVRSCTFLCIEKPFDSDC